MDGTWQPRTAAVATGSSRAVPANLSVGLVINDSEISGADQCPGLEYSARLIVRMNCTPGGTTSTTHVPTADKLP